MASKSGLTWDSVVKAGTDMMEIAGASLQRTMKIQEVTGTKDNDSQPGGMHDHICAHQLYGDSTLTLARMHMIQGPHEVCGSGHCVVS